jgi:ferredoxin
MRSEGERMKIVIDESRCEANGVCVRVAPEAFHLDDKDLLHLLPEAGATPRSKLEQAVRVCPRQALSLKREGPPGKDTADVA